MRNKESKSTKKMLWDHKEGQEAFYDYDLC